MASGMIFLSRPLTKIMFSEEFIEAQAFVPVLILAFFYSAYNIFYGAIFTAYKKTNVIFYTTGAGAVVNLFLNLFLIKSCGIIGAGIATLISNFVVYISRKNAVKTYVNISNNGKSEICIHLLLICLTIGETISISRILITFIEMTILALIMYFDRKLFKNALDWVKRKI